jgi:hypothetical protein
MNTPSILRHSKAHRTAVVRNAVALKSRFDCRVTIRCLPDRAKYLRAALETVGCVVREVTELIEAYRTDLVVALPAGKPVMLDQSGDLFEITKTEKVRR